MSIEEFRASLEQSEPPEAINALLRSLWYDGKDNWSKAHALVDQLGGADAARIHAYLHRKEGDIWNADYWYRRANTTRPTSSLEEEWDELVRWQCDI